jgi:putative tricarboxylic transport membrane protein
MAPLVLGIILGDLMDKNLRRGLTLSDGDFTPFFTRPISMVFWIIIVLTILFSIGPARRGFAALGRRVWSVVQPGGTR